MHGSTETRVNGGILRPSELQQAGRVAAVVLAAFAQSWREHNRFRIVWAARIATTFLFLAPILFMSRAYGSAGFAASGGGHDFVTYAAVGLVVINAAIRPMTATMSYLSSANGVGILPALWSTPAPRWALCLGASLAALTDAVIEGGVIIALAFLIFGPSTQAVSALAVVPLVFGLATFWGLGLVFGSVFLATRSWTAQAIVTGLLLTLAGTVFPITILPWSVRWVSYAFPHTYVLDALRHLVLGTPTIVPLPVDLAIAGASAILAVLAGIALFRRADREAARRGVIGLYT